MKKLILLVLGILPASAFCTDLNVTGFIYATQSIAAGTYLYSYGNINCVTYITANGAILAGTYSQGNAFKTTNGILSAGVLNAAAIGSNATAYTYSGLTVGQYNVGKALDGTTAASVSAWRDGTSSNPVDPLLEVGIGTSSTAKNAFAIYKDGTITMSKAQGDISMGNYGN